MSTPKISFLMSNISSLSLKKVVPSEKNVSFKNWGKSWFDNEVSHLQLIWSTWWLGNRKKTSHCMAAIFYESVFIYQDIFFAKGLFRIKKNFIACSVTICSFELFWVWLRKIKGEEKMKRNRNEWFQKKVLLGKFKLVQKGGLGKFIANKG